MTKMSDVAVPSLLFTEGTVPSTPAAGKQRLYYDSTSHLLKTVNSSGTATNISTGIASGTSNPGSPSDGDLFYRTDLDLMIRYRSSGTRWVTTNLFRESVGPVGVNPFPLTITSTMGYLTQWSTTFDLWLENLYTSTFVLTTNDGSKFWTITANKQVANGTQTSLASFTTGSGPDGASVWVRRATSIGAALVAATYFVMDLTATKTSTAGNLYWAASVSYRLIVT